MAGQTFGDLPVELFCRTDCMQIVVASEAKQFIAPLAETSIASPAGA
jgi:hypothetical protein